MNFVVCKLKFFIISLLCQPIYSVKKIIVTVNANIKPKYGCVIGRFVNCIIDNNRRFRLKAGCKMWRNTHRNLLASINIEINSSPKCADFEPQIKYAMSLINNLSHVIKVDVWMLRVG